MQTRTMSFVETATNVTVGFIVATIANCVVLPAFGAKTTFTQNLEISVIFTMVSLVRSYAMRRFFNSLQSKSEKPPTISDTFEPYQIRAGKP